MRQFLSDRSFVDAFFFYFVRSPLLFSSSRVCSFFRSILSSLLFSIFLLHRVTNLFFSSTTKDKEWIKREREGRRGGGGEAREDCDIGERVLEFSSSLHLCDDGLTPVHCQSCYKRNFKSVLIPGVRGSWSF